MARSNDDGFGIYVEAPTGQVYFLPEAVAQRHQVPRTNLLTAMLRAGRTLDQLVSKDALGKNSDPPPLPKKSPGPGGPIRHPSSYCGRLLHWLLHHKVTPKWRALSVAWMNDC